MWHMVKSSTKTTRVKWATIVSSLALVGISFISPSPVTASDIAEPGDRPNVLFLLSDDQRPDTIHALGNSIIETPYLDRLVNRGTAFTRAVCANPICTPSRAEIMSGCTSFQNGVLDFGRKIKPELSLWAQTMQKAGYRTSYVGKWHNDGMPGERGYDRSLGFYRGGGGPWAVPQFDRHGRPVTGYRGWIFQTEAGQKFPERGVGLTSNISEDFADAAIELIKQKSEKPFFLHVNFTAPHDPLLMPHGYDHMYDPKKIPVPENFLTEHPFDHGNFSGRDEKLFAWPRTKIETQNELAVYYAVISHMDEQIGRILDTLEKTSQLENTIIVFSSDHGLSVGSHGLRGKQSMYEHTIGVPMILTGPSIPEKKRSNAQCYLRDLFPTICDLCGIEIPKTVQGKSLKPVLDGTVETIYPFTVGYFRNFQRMIRTDEWKLIHYPHLDRYQLFHLVSDPFEKTDLSQDEKYKETKSELQQKLLNWLKDNDDPLMKNQ